MKFILIKAGHKAEVIEEEKLDCDKVRAYLGIDSPVTCVTRRIDGKYHDLWVDDEGLLKEDRVLCGALVDYSGENKEVLVGGMVIADSDVEGNTVGLSDADIESIMKAPHIVDMDGFSKYVGNDPDKDLVLSGYDGGALTIKAHSQFLAYNL